MHLCAKLLLKHTSILLLWYSWSVLRASDSLSGEDLGVDCQKKRSKGDSHIKGSSRTSSKCQNIQTFIQTYKCSKLSAFEDSLHTHYIDYRVLYIHSWQTVAV